MVNDKQNEDAPDVSQVEPLADTPHELVADAMTLLEPKWASLNAGKVSADDTPESALVGLIVELGDVLVDAAPYAGPWELGHLGPVPRRKLAGPANFLVGEGMYVSWKKWYVEDGVAPHVGLLREAFPQELADPFPGRLRLPLRWLLRRSGSRCGPNADSRVAQAAARMTLKSITEEFPDASRTDEWVVHRLLNGMLPSYFRRVPGNPLAYTVELRFTEEMRDPQSPYLLPSARALVEQLAVGGTLVLRELAFRYPGDGADVVVTMSGSDPSPDWMRARARRAWACAYLLAAEIDRHIVMGHLITELVLVGLHVKLSHDHPLRRLLEPFLQYVDVANHIGDQLVWGPYGVMVQGSGVTATGLHARFAERMGAYDWRNFRPHTRELAPNHYAPAVQGLFWDVVCGYVDDAFNALQMERVFPTASDPEDPALVGAADELRNFCTMIEAASVPRSRYDGLVGPSDFVEATELSFDDGPHAFSAVQSLADLRQFCAFVVYCATLGHGWSNVRQFEEGGEPAYASFGLRARIDSQPPPNVDDAAWHERAAPRPCDVANQLLQGFVLSYLPVATLESERNGPRGGDALRADVLLGQRSLGDRVAELEPRFAELARRNSTGVPDRQCASSAIPARPNA